MTATPYERYQTEINAIFTEESHLKYQLLVEKTLAKAHMMLGKIPKEAYEEIANACDSGKITLKRVKEIEKETHHDVMAMVLAISEQCPKYGGYVHLGATSYDIQDTVLGLQLKAAKSIILKHLVEFKDALTHLILKTKDLVAIGRTHGQHAIPITYGFKFANYLSEITLAENLLKNAEVAFGKMSGAVGTYASFGTDEVEKIVMQQLGLKKLPITTQIIPRIVHFSYLSALAAISSVLARLATEIRQLQRTEIGEVYESFGKKQVGSSTMPQKRNPHRSERVCGLTRVIQSHLQVALDNIILEHERDLTNSSAERYIIPQMTILTDFIIVEMTKILTHLEINEANIRKNLYLLNGRQCAERLMIRLSDSIGRQTAHELLKQLSKEQDFKKAVMEHPVIKEALSEKEILNLLDPKTYIGLAAKKAESVARQLHPKIPSDYARAGVSLAAEEDDIKRIGRWVKKTHQFGKVAAKFGHYANLIEWKDDWLLALTADGVGSKVLVAQMAEKYDTIGIDCVAMNVNDLISMGIRPVAFVDYLAVESPLKERAEEIAKGLYEGCRQAEIPLLGGEYATLPEIIKGIDSKGFDLAGAALGVVRRKNLITGDAIQAGDAVIGISSNGLHSNGYTLARKVLLNQYPLDYELPWEISIADELLKPTYIYTKPILSLLENNTTIHGLAHITGSGFKKLHRITKYGFEITTYPKIPEIFHFIQQNGNISYQEMFSTFNMGIGFIVITPMEEKEDALSQLNKFYPSYELGIITKDSAVNIKPYKVIL